MRKKRLLCGLVCIALFLSGCTDAFDAVLSGYLGQGGQPAQAAYERKPLYYADIAYQRPDLAAALARLEEAREQLSRGNDKALFAAYEALLQDHEHYISMYVYARIQLDLNIYDDFYSAEYAALGEDYLRFEAELDGLTADMLSQGHGDALAARYGETFVAQARLKGLRAAEKIRPLALRDEELIQEYTRVRAGFTVSYDGRDWTYEQLGSGDLDYEEYIQLRLLYCDELGEALWPIFDEMRGLRTQMAALAGYSSFAAYQYDNYCRDYAPNRAQTLYAAVKRYVAPLFTQLMHRYFTLDVNGYYGETFELWPTLERLNTVMAQFSPRLSGALSGMLDRGLFDVSAGANKRNAAYTTHMREYAAPYLFMQWTPSPDSVTTFVHEMGHYCASYYRSDGYSYCSFAPLDLFEIESQGLELLFLEYYDELFEHSDAAAYTTVLNIMYALLAGCMEDEFQQRLYADPNLTYEDACALYRQLGEEYGFADVYVFEPSSWALVSHTFTSPLYYLSYAVSAITAFELLAASAVDFPKAADTYWQLQDRGESAPLLTTLSACGLSDPFSEETVAAVCRDVEAYLDRLVEEQGNAA